MHSDSNVAADGERGKELLGGSIRAWLRDHSLAAVALGVTLLAAAGYCVHRSWLLGWYQAAGVPAFAHGWSVQDVIMLGVLNLRVWLHGLGSVAVAGALVYLEFVAVAYAEKWIDRKLGSRKKHRDATSSTRRLGSKFKLAIAHVSVCAMFIVGAALLYFSIFLMVYLFSAQPRNLGREQYLELQKAAETTIRAAMKLPTSEAPEANDVKEATDYMLARHRYVQVTVGIGDVTRHHCGWLVLQNGEHMLLLTRSGPLFLSATGLGFSWTPTKIEDC
jgi:hypothetical protein